VDPATGERRSGPLDEAAVLQRLTTGENYHQSAVRLLGRWARDGVPFMDARARLVASMERVTEDQRDARWRTRFADIDRCLEDIYGKEAGARDRGERPWSRRAIEASGAADLTEHSVAALFADQYADQLRYCHTDGYWYIWRGTHWGRDETRLAFDHIRRHVALLTEGADRKIRTTTGRANFAGAVERFAQADPVLATTTAMMDQDPWLLATPGGTVDLGTGHLREADPSDLISRCTAAAPAATAKCPLWLRFLDEALEGDRDAIAFLQRWFGYCLTGLVREHKLVFVVGPGGNGKSVMITTFYRLLQNYAVAATLDAFTAARGERHSTDLAMLAGARFIVVLETEEGRDWAESRVKAFTGGDPITAHFMRRDNFTFVPTGKITISGNHAPALQNVDEAARRRFLIVPFHAQPRSPDPRLIERLEAEWPGILRWAIEGCLEWQRVGLAPPKAVQAATSAYFGDQDLFGQWLDECCEHGSDLGEATSPLFDSWRSFALGRGEPVGSAKRFATAMDRRGFQRGKDCGAFRGRGYLGLRLLRGACPPHLVAKQPAGGAR
jgi:putative DNA primase/helicase